jgi:hypothetical protein
VCGPTLIAQVRQSTGYYTEALELIAGIMLVSAVLPFVIRPPRSRNAESRDAVFERPNPSFEPKKAKHDCDNCKSRMSATTQRKEKKTKQRLTLLPHD